MMDFRVRQCCCALHTFVRIACILLSLLFSLVALSFGLWHALSSNRREPSNVQTVSVALVVVFCIVGLGVNLLVLLGIAKNRRSLLLPWLVFKLMLILGCFCVAIYVGLHFTVLQDEDNNLVTLQGSDDEEEDSQKAYAVFCLFPAVTGIFFIFLWIMVDQLFIQMRTMKQLGMKSVSSSNLSHVQQPRSGSSAAQYANYAGSSGTIRSVASSYCSGGKVKRNPSNRTNNMKRIVPAASNTKPILAYQTQSLPRPSNKKPNGKVHQKNYKPTVAIIPSKMSTGEPAKRAKSLEQILGEGQNIWSASSSTSSSGEINSKKTISTTSGASTGDSDNLASGYCTIDRSRLRKRTSSSSTSASKMKNSSSQTLPRKPIRKHLKKRNGDEELRVRSKSVDVFDRKRPPIESSVDNEDTDEVDYIGDLGGLDELRRVTSQHKHTIIETSANSPSKTVKIHPNVTEFHYPGDDDVEVEDEIAAAAQSRQERENRVPVIRIPEPVFPSSQQQQHTSNNNMNNNGKATSAWFSKLTPKSKGSSSFTKDELIDLYCQHGDVQL